MQAIIDKLGYKGSLAEFAAFYAAIRNFTTRRRMNCLRRIEL